MHGLQCDHVTTARLSVERTSSVAFGGASPSATRSSYTTYGHPYVTRYAIDSGLRKASTVHNVTNGDVGPGYM